MRAEHLLELTLAQLQLHLALPAQILTAIGAVQIIITDIQGEIDHLNVALRLTKVDPSLTELQ